MNFINFFIIKTLVTPPVANIINISAKEEIIPELLQSKCNSENIYKIVCEYLESPIKMQEQVSKTQIALDKFRTDKSPSEIASQALNRYL